MKPIQGARTGSHAQRRGVTIVMVIAFYAVAVTMIGVWVRSALGHQRQVGRWHEKTQVSWLAAAGVRRGAARISIDTDYRGERWQIAAAELGGNDSAEVVIRIEPVVTSKRADGQPEITERQVRIVAVAQYPANGQSRVQTTKSVEFPLPVTSDRSGESS